MVRAGFGRNSLFFLLVLTNNRNVFTFVSEYSLIMTEKQERILNAALHLFATMGYASTSTSKVAKKAGVSEGLIFRHFKNKEGLLEAILTQGKIAVREVFADIVLTNNPKERIRKLVEMPFTIPENQYEMWRLIYALKWQTNRYEDDDQQSVRVVLKDAFVNLGYKNPEAEVDLLFVFLDGAATAMLLHPPKNPESILRALLKKYNL